MTLCPITYQPIAEGQRYSRSGLTFLATRLSALELFPYSAARQIEEAVRRAGKISVQGVQPKLSARLSVSQRTFVIVDSRGHYIIKPQNPTYPELPQNEDVTMRMAAACDIVCPLHGLLHCTDGTLSYFIKRFDRRGRSARIHVEDFAQISGRTRDTKYDSSMEQVAETINRHCTFPVPQRLELFRRTLFCLLCGNEDMHLKNFTLMHGERAIKLSPAYDMVNSTLALGAGAHEELALPLNGKKRNLTRRDVFGYFAAERLQLRPAVIDDIRKRFRTALPVWRSLLDRSFLSPGYKSVYLSLVEERAARLLE